MTLPLSSNISIQDTYMKNSNLRILDLEEPNKKEVAINACMHVVWRQSLVLNFQSMVSLLTEAEILYHAASISEAI